MAAERGGRSRLRHPELFPALYTRVSDFTEEHVEAAMIDNTDLPRIAVFGAGVMGVGITTLAIGSGLPVVLVDVDPDALATARDRVRRELRLAHMMGALPRTGPVGELVTPESVADAAGATAVIESITEAAELKIKV